MTWLTLLIRVATLPCREVVTRRCLGCPLPPGLRSGDVLPTKVLDKVLNVISDLRFNEAVVLCPPPTRHPRLEYILSKLLEVSRRVYLVTPIGDVGRVKKSLLDYLDELVLITPTLKDFRLNEEYVRTLLSNGFDKVTIYASLPSAKMEFIEEVISIVKYVSKYGLRVRVGEYLYLSREDVDVRDEFISRGYEVGLTYGYLYGYRATSAFIGSYPVTLLTKPREPNCRKLYIGPGGRISKCPFYGTSINALDELSMDEIRKLIYSPCPLVRPNIKELIPKVEVSLTTPDGKVIPSDVLVLLEVVSQVRSLRTACELLGIPVSTYVEKLKRVERELGVKLVISRKGGPKRGASELTREAEEIIKLYRRVRDSVLEVLFKEGLGAETA